MDLYKILEIERGASNDEIRKSYLKMSKKHHPDRGGDQEHFKKIQKAYDVLSDAQSRDFYDMTGSIPGEDGAPDGPMMHEMHGGFPFDMGNIFGTMFGGHGRGGAGGAGGPVTHQKQPKGPTKVQEIGLILQQFYNGHRLEMKFERMKFCDTCKGSGAAQKDNCNGCNGSGVQVQKVMMGPIIMSSTGPCGICAGKGTIIKNKCGDCSGEGRIGDNRQIAIMIDAGMGPGDALVFENGCSDDPLYEKPGDVKIILQEAAEDHGWKRTGDVLEYNIVLGLGESLVGATKKITGHPRQPEGIYVTVPAATVTGDVLVLKGDGMPVRGGNGRKGDARLRVTVVPRAEERAVLEEKGVAVLREMLGVKAEWTVSDAIAVQRSAVTL
jgi:DnaJ-class molecular chaperone